MARSGFVSGALGAVALLLSAVFANPAALANAGGASDAAVRLIDLAVVEGRVEGAALQVAPGAPLLRIDHGQAVVLRWASDVPLVLHLHGYDIELAVTPDAPEAMAFTARAMGRFAVASHGEPGPGRHRHHETLLYLEVHPR